MKNLAVVIGRFQPFHNGHLHLIKGATEVAHTILILVGSAHSPRSLRNPWTYEERRTMIINSLIEAGVWEVERFRIEPLQDHYYNDEAWLEEANSIISNFYSGEKNVCLVGHDKDSSTYYMRMFPQFDVIEIDNHDNINATDIREVYFRSGLVHSVPRVVDRFVDNIPSNEAYSALKNEWEYIESYKKSWSSSPYPPIFVTVDAVVVCSGHVLVVERGEYPGKGLMALPGGFINPDEKLINAALRELKEETRLKMPIKAIKGNLVAQHVFDHPDRSMRGRTLSHGFYFHLDPGVLPEVRGADDAAKAFWKPLSEIDRRDFFEDHYHIIRYFL